MVLILVVVDNGLVPCKGRMMGIRTEVLILVVVDNGLVLPWMKDDLLHPDGLNPCCSGQWSRTIANYDLQGNNDEVLILVVVDNGLVLYSSYNSRF